MGSYVIVNNLPPVPTSLAKKCTTEELRWFQSIRDRIGGPSGDLIYDAANSSQAITTLEGFFIGAIQQMRQELTGLVMQQIEQIQEQTFDPTALITENYTQPFVEAEPFDGVSAQYIIGAAAGSFSAELTAGVGLTGGGTITNGAILSIANAGVTSIIAGTDITVSGATGDVTVNAVQQAPNYEEFVATAAQAVFNTTINTTAKAGVKSYLQVFVNGVFKQEGALLAFTVTGTNQITFNAGLVGGENVVIYSWS